MTKEIQLGNGGISLIDDIDYPLISQYKWNKCLKDRRIFYAVHIDHCMINNEKKMITMLMHRVILKLEKGQLCDHINNDGLDNRRCNLRIATPSQNMMNRRKISIFSSKYKGVTWHKQGGCWQSQIRYGDKNYYLGIFNDEIRAAKAYDEKAIELFGEYARLNFGVDKI